MNADLIRKALCVVGILGTGIACGMAYALCTIAKWCDEWEGREE